MWALPTSVSVEAYAVFVPVAPAARTHDRNEQVEAGTEAPLSERFPDVVLVRRDAERLRDVEEARGVVALERF